MCVRAHSTHLVLPAVATDKCLPVFRRSPRIAHVNVPTVCTCFEPCRFCPETSILRVSGPITTLHRPPPDPNEREALPQALAPSLLLHFAIHVCNGRKTFTEGAEGREGGGKIMNGVGCVDNFSVKVVVTGSGWDD